MPSMAPRSGTEPDIAVVGAGIAGGALATVMARAGAGVLLLERQATYRDRVRGELMWPWGVAEVQRLGLDSVLHGAGAHVADRFVSHDEGSPGEPASQDLSGQVPGVPGSLNLYHPAATEALAAAATTSGARRCSGVRTVSITAGPRPEISWTDADGRHETRCGLIVGADGRSSAVRKQAGITLHRDPPAHLATGLLVADLEGIDEQTDLVARGDDLLFLGFPQGAGRARLYFCMPNEQRGRFAGPSGAAAFLDTCRLMTSLPDSAAWSHARVAGPCATFSCEDTWVDRPDREGVVLIGDAAGWNNPLIGQGLALAVRDAGTLSDALLAGVGPEALATYGAGRSERLRRARIACLVDVWANDHFQTQDPAERGRRYERIAGDALLTALDDAQWTGFERLSETPSDDVVRERLFG